MPSLDRLPPYSMCSPEECDDRERFKEVSVFEERRHHEHDDDGNGNGGRLASSSSSASGPRSRRRIDPCLAVSKYRRSAAGSSAEDRYPVRTVEQLTMTVDHLLDILTEQAAPPARQTHADGDVVAHQGRVPSSFGRRETLQSTVSFVEDRLRAVQVDLVKLRHPESSRGLQVRVARCHILILYLMADRASYEATFGCASLRTALSSYLLSSPPLPNVDDEGSDTDQLEEMLSYAILFALRQDLVDAAQQREGGLFNAPLVSTSAALASHRHLLQARLRRPIDPSLHWVSKLEWTMTLLSHVVVGHWHMALRHLDPRPGAGAVVQLNGSNREEQVHDVFVIRARCLLAPCLQHLRLEALKAYNASFGKGEAVAASDVANLLQMPPFTGDDSSSLGRSKSTWDSATESMPLSDAYDYRENHDASRAAVRFGRDVGLHVDPNGMLLFKVASSPPLREVVPGRKIRDDEDGLIFYKVGCDAYADADADFRTDEDGVRVPPPAWTRRFTG